ELSPTQRVVLRLSDPLLARTLREAANVRLALSVADLSAPAFMAALIGGRVRSGFFVLDRLFAVVGLFVAPQESFVVGQAVRALALDYNLLPLGLRSAQGQERPDRLDAHLAEGDCLTVVMTLVDLQRLLKREKPPRIYAVEATEMPSAA